MYVTARSFTCIMWPSDNHPSEKLAVGPIAEREPSRDLNAVWVWGIVLVIFRHSLKT